MTRARRSSPLASVTSEWGNLIRKAEHIAAGEKGRSVYQIEPVDLETFVTHPDYLNQGLWGMSKAQKEVIETGSDLENDITFMVLFIGKGGGKNWSVIILFLYTIYKLMCMYDPHGYLDHNAAKAITLLNVAINATQAKKNFFDPMANMLKAAGPKAFSEFGFNHETDILSSQIIFPKNIEVISGNSRGGGIEGYDTLLAVADEVDDVEFHGVDKIIDTLRTSSQSRFRGKEKVAVISYQRYVGSSGKISELYTQATGHSHIFARKYSSWEFHPVLTREDFQTYFDENPEKADCMYGSVISGGFVDSWIKDSIRIKNAMNWERSWIFDWPLPYDPDEIGSETWKAKVAHREWQASPASEMSYYDEATGRTRVLDPYDIPIREMGDPNKIYVLCGDPAAGSEANGGDGYGLSMGHRETVVRDGVTYVRPVVDFSFRFTGRMFEEGQVQMVAVENLIRKLKEQYGYNIRYFSFDGWNCSVSGSYILTPNGYRRVESLSEGDEVLGKNGQINTVVASELRDDVRTVKVKTDIGLSFEVTENHPVMLDTGEWRMAGELTPKDRLSLQDFTGSFGYHHDPDRALMYGYLVAEGDWRDYGYSHSLTFTNEEEEVREDYLKVASKLFPGSFYVGPRRVATGRKDVVKAISSDMESGSWNKHVPEWLFSCNEKTIGMFLSGLYEGDGNVVVSRYGSSRAKKDGTKSPLLRVELNTVSEALSKEVQLLLLQMGIKSWRKHYKRKTPKGEDTSYYRLLIYGENLRLFHEKIGFRSSRKQDLLDEAISLLVGSRASRANLWKTTVTSVEESVNTIVHMEVSGDHTYLGEGVVNHNSLSLTQWLSKTYPGIVVRDRNIVETKDYSATRDAIFGEAPPTNGKGTRESNGGIDLPWHPILFEEFRNLRERRDVKGGKVDHTATSSKDIADTVAKLVYIINYEWPFSDASLLTSHGNLTNRGRPEVTDLMRARIQNNMATSEEKRVYYENMASDSVGLGKFLNRK